MLYTRVHTPTPDQHSAHSQPNYHFLSYRFAFSSHYNYDLFLIFISLPYTCFLFLYFLSIRPGLDEPITSSSYKLLPLDGVKNDITRNIELNRFLFQV
jgi:hypothetical protein